MGRGEGRERSGRRFSSGRLSKGDACVLHDMANGLQVDRMVEEAKKEEEHEEETGERMGRVYAIP